MRHFKPLAFKIFSALLILTHTALPLVSFALAPQTIFAQDQTHTQLGFDTPTNSFTLTVSQVSEVSYVLTYYREGSTSQEAITGTSTTHGDTYTTSVFAGTASTNTETEEVENAARIPHTPTNGKLVVTGKKTDDSEYSYTSYFNVSGGSLETIIESELGAPTPLGYNSWAWSYGAPNERPVDFQCGATVVTYQAPVAFNWSTVTNESVTSPIRYLTHNVELTDGGATTTHTLRGGSSSSVMTDPATQADDPSYISDNLSNSYSDTSVGSFQNATSLDIGTYTNRVRAFIDSNNNSEFDLGEPLSPWSSDCAVTLESDRATTTLTVGGIKYEDVNGNGIQDAGEPGLPGWEIVAMPRDTIGLTRIYADSETPAEGPVLESGKEYFMMASGTYNAGGGITADAKYSIRLPDTVWTDYVQGAEEKGPDHLELFVNGAPIAWGPYDPNTGANHYYGALIQGTGSPASLIVNDDNYSDNTGIMRIAFYEVHTKTITDSTGHYSMLLTKPTTDPEYRFTVYEILQHGWIQTDPGGKGGHSFHQSIAEGMDFGNRRYPNGNVLVCVRTEEQEPLPNWDIVLTPEGSSDGSALTTGENGCAAYSEIATGTYDLQEVVPQGWEYVSGGGTITVDEEGELFIITNRIAPEPTPLPTPSPSPTPEVSPSPTPAASPAPTATPTSDSGSGSNDSGSNASSNNTDSSSNTSNSATTTQASGTVLGSTTTARTVNRRTLAQAERLAPTEGTTNSETIEEETIPATPKPATPDQNIEPESGQVLAATDEACTTHTLWWLALVLFGIVELGALFFFSSSANGRLTLAVVGTLGASLILYFLRCEPWPWIMALGALALGAELIARFLFVQEGETARR